MSPWSSRKKAVDATRVLIALLLFTQLAIVAQACTLPKLAIPMLQTAAAHTPAPCCKQMSENVCLSQNVQGDQALSDVPSAAAVSAPAIALDYSAYQAPPAIVLSPQKIAAMDFGEPPPTLRFCSFQT